MAKEPQIAKIAIKPVLMSATGDHSLALFGHPRRGPRSTICQIWPPFCRLDCRTEGFKTAKHYKNRGLGTTTSPMTKWPVFGHKDVLKPENGAF